MSGTKVLKVLVISKWIGRKPINFFKNFLFFIKFFVVWERTPQLPLTSPLGGAGWGDTPPGSGESRKLSSLRP